MLNNTTTTKLHEMKLSAMATAFRHQSETDGFSELSFEERFGLLVDAEWTSRRNNRLTRLLKKAGFSEPGACCKQSSKVHTFSPANAHFFSASFLAGNGLVVS